MTPEVLAGRALSRQEFVAALAEHGVAVEDNGQAPTHVLVYLSTLGLTCRGTDRGRDATFVLVEDWLPHSASEPVSEPVSERAAEPASGPRGEDALAELARRYFRAFSPATPADFTTWSGLPSAKAVALIRDELTPVSVDGRPGFRLGEVAPARGSRLLPAFDNYLVGYRDRGALIDAAGQPKRWESRR